MLIHIAKLLFQKGSTYVNSKWVRFVRNEEWVLGKKDILI